MAVTPFRAFRYGAIVGVAVCVFLFGSYLLFDHMFGEREVWLWPTSILLMASDGWSIGTVVLLTVAVAGNAILYGVLAMFASMAVRAAQRH